jgi:type IV secretion system protein VirB4
MPENSLKTISMSEYIPPYSNPINRHMINLTSGQLMATLQIPGIPFEFESRGSLDAAFNSVRNLLNQLATRYGNKLAVWTHIVKQKEEFDSEYQCDIPFVQSFIDKYVGTFEGQRFFTTNYYITFVYHYSGGLDGAEATLDDIIDASKAALGQFGANVLSISDDGSTFENVEFLTYLLNNVTIKQSLNDARVVDMISRSDWHFGYDVLEIMPNDSQTSRYATFYELEALPVTHSGMWDFMLAQQCEFVLTQSMIFMKSSATLKMLDEQKNLVESGDNAAHELQEMADARDYVATGEISFGDHHCSLAVFSDTQAGAIEDGNELSALFNNRGALLKRANLRSLFSFFSMLPGSKNRVMPSPRTTTNLACTWSLHNHAKGKAKLNPIGDGSALIPLRTTSDTLFYLNCHTSDLNEDSRGLKYAGSTMILGASGTGKTTLEGTIMAFLQRFSPQIFSIDYNRSSELSLRAYGATYFTIAEGVDTGLNPFQLDDSPKLRSFLNRLVCRICAGNQDGVSDSEELTIKNAIDSVMRLDIAQRGLSALMDSIPQPELRTRLGKWCRSENGKYAWSLDSPINQFNPADMQKVGFDATLLLNKHDGRDHPVSEAVLSVLFFLKELMQQDGQLMVTLIAEFWMPANQPLTAGIMNETLKAGRTKGEFMILSSQSPEDAIDCTLFPAIIQQTATKIYLPNPDAEFEGYKKCGLNQIEFDKLKALHRLSRQFLIKQAGTSCIAKLNLAGFDDHLPIISGTIEDIALCEKLRAIHGDDPTNWIPIFQQTQKERKR